MSKEGLLTKDEEKFYGKLIVGELPIKGLLKPIAGFGVPYLVATLDNKYGDKIPEPWQTHLEKLTTIFYKAAQDGHIDAEEREHIANYCVVVMNAEIDIPKKTEEQELVIFLGFWKFVSTIIWSDLQKVG